MGFLWNRSALGLAGGKGGRREAYQENQKRLSHVKSIFSIVIFSER